MAYKEKVQNRIKKDELRDLWEKIYESYEQGGAGQIKLILDQRISKFRKDYQQQIEKLEKML